MNNNQINESKAYLQNPQNIAMLLIGAYLGIKTAEIFPSISAYSTIFLAGGIIVLFMASRKKINF